MVRKKVIIRDHYIVDNIDSVKRAPSFKNVRKFIDTEEGMNFLWTKYSAVEKELNQKKLEKLITGRLYKLSDQQKWDILKTMCEDWTYHEAIHFIKHYSSEYRLDVDGSQL